MDYWNELITTKSWEKLLELRKIAKFTLIGGWACYLWTRAHKSKDIDIILKPEELYRLKAERDLKKNDRLRKYELLMDEIDVDIYVPHYSKLAIPVEEVQRHIARIEGFELAKPEVLLLLKQGAEMARRASEKGLKDRIDIIDILLKTDFDYKEYNKLAGKFGLSAYRKRLIEIVSGFRETEYLDLNPREFKKAKQEILEKIKEASKGER